MGDIPKNICRICEKYNSDSTDLTLSENQELVRMFLHCADVSFNCDDKLPKYFCHQCIDTLNIAHQFREQCETAHRKFMNLLATNEPNEKSPLTPSPVFDSELGANLSTADPPAINVSMSCTDKLELPQESMLETYKVFLINDKVNNKNNGQCAIEPVVAVSSVAPTKSDFNWPENTIIYSNETEIVVKSETACFCDICEKIFYSAELLQKHKQQHFRSFVCETCAKPFTTQKFLNDHLLTHNTDDKPYECKFCLRKYRQPNSLRAHMQKHSGERPYKCTFCNATFLTKYSMNVHNNIHKELKQFVCTTCGKAFTFKCGLDNHIKVHSDQKPFKCDICEEAFKFKNTLQCHVRTHTGEKPNICSICEKGFTTVSALYSHQRIHNRKRVYECPICKEKFRSKVSDVHMRRHSGEKPYPCNVCYKKFPTNGELVTHLRMHTGERPYFCTICQTGFLKNKLLDKHLKMHADNTTEWRLETAIGNYTKVFDERLHKCAWCSAGFLSRKSLEFHKKKHTGGKSHACANCGQGFTTVGKLNEHMQIHEAAKVAI